MAKTGLNNTERTGPSNPCRVCGDDSKDSKCLTADGRICDRVYLCRRDPVDPAQWKKIAGPSDGDFYTYAHVDDLEKKPKGGKTKGGKSKPSILTAKQTEIVTNSAAWVKNLNDNWRFAEALGKFLGGIPDSIFRLFQLGLKTESFQDSNDEKHYLKLGAHYTIPERDGFNLIIGCANRFEFRDRSIESVKKAEFGGERGLTIPDGWMDRPGPLFLVEGFTNTAAMTACGLPCVGRPGNMAGVEYLAELLADWPEDRPIVVVGDYDEKNGKNGQPEKKHPDGSFIWPGKEGAKHVSGELAARLGRKVLWTLPPDGAKDVRVWLTSRAEEWPDRGVKIAAGLMAGVQEGEAKVSGENMPWSVAEAGFDGSPYPWGRFQLTDMGNSHRMAHLYGKDIIYVPLWKKWLIWNGVRWASDELMTVNQMVRRAIEGIWVEAQEGPTETAKETAMMWWKKCQSANQIEAMLRTTESLVCKTPDDFNTHNHLINATNGTIDLRTGELKRGNREDLITYTCKVAYNPKAECPKWLAALDKIFALDPLDIKKGGNDQIIQFFKILCGYFLTGETKEQYFPIFQGDGSNGKSLIIKIISSIMGGDYSMKAPRDFLVEKKFNDHPTEIAQLYGKRLVISSELKVGQKLDMGFIKDLTGEADQRGRGMNKDFSQFQSHLKLLLLTNPEPDLGEQDYATIRRIAYIKFKTCFWDPARKETGPPELRKNTNLEAELMGELPGIFRWMVEGAMQYYREGQIDFPNEVVESTSKYIGEQDAVKRFLEECTIRNEYEWVEKGILYAAYKRWCENTNTKPIMRDRLFSKKMIGHKFEPERFTPDKKHRIWKGITLKSADEEEHKDYARSDNTVFDTDSFGSTDDNR